MMQFFIPLRKIPTVTQQGHKISTSGGKKRIHDTAELRTVRQLFRDHLARHRPEAPLEGPVELYVVWCYPDTKTHPAGTWKTTKPDTDNLIKLVKDEMTRLGFWLDDAQVCMELNAKCYDRISGVSFRIRSMTERCSPGEDRDPGDDVCERSHTLLADPEPVPEKGGGEDG